MEGALRPGVDFHDGTPLGQGPVRRHPVRRALALAFDASFTAGVFRLVETWVDEN